jgi:hypothetical protein
MKRLKFIPIGLATLVLTMVPAFAAQTEAAGTAAQTAKKAKTNDARPPHHPTRQSAASEATSAAEQAGGAAGKQASEATGTAVKSGKIAAPQATEPARRAKTAATGTAQRAATTVPESEIAAAKASGKVWVNTDTGVYHKSGQWYGATKQGKFMTEQEAIKAGYRASKGKER